MKTRSPQLHIRRRLVSALLSLGALAQSSAWAALAPGVAVPSGNTNNGPSYSYNGELFLVVYDDGSTGREAASYTLDLGVTLTSFVGSYTSDAGKQQFWALTDTNWTSFLASSDRDNLRWLVNGYDASQVTGTASTQNSLPKMNFFTTLKQGTESNVFDLDLLDPTQSTGQASAVLTNSQFYSSMTSSGKNWTDALNKTGTHGTATTNATSANYTLNGSSFNLESAPDLSYFLKIGAPGIDLGGALTQVGAESSNAVGASSWFYRLIAEDFGEADDAPILIDEADNLTADAYWGFIYVDPALYPDSPYAGQYLLSYTLEGSSSAAALARREFAYSIGRTETTGGWRVNRLEGIAAATAGESPSWLGSQPLGVVSSVPENGTALTLLTGLGLLGAAWQRRRGGQAG